MNKYKKLDLFKTTIASSFLIASLSVAYYFVIFLPAQHADLITNTSASTVSLQQTSTLHLLEQCLNAAVANKDDTLTKLLNWAKENNYNSEHDLTGAFDSIDEEYERRRKDCIAKYPQ
jgi:hypothetical protein